MHTRSASRLGISKLFYLALLLAGMSVAFDAEAQQGSGRLLNNLPVTATTADGVLEGTLSINDLSLDEAGQLVAAGVLQGTVGGEQFRQVFQDVVVEELTEGGAQTECDILFLDLGPLFLDVLGLQVDLSQITLDITAVRGPGNLLGNLLCAVAGLLDGFTLDAALQNILENILDVINQLL